MSKNYLEKRESSESFLESLTRTVAEEVRGSAKELMETRGRISETSRMGSEEDHRKFIETSSRSNARRTSKETDRSEGVEVKGNVFTGAFSIFTGKRSKDRTDYER